MVARIPGNRSGVLWEYIYFVGFILYDTDAELRLDQILLGEFTR